MHTFLCIGAKRAVRFHEIEREREGVKREMVGGGASGDLPMAVRNWDMPLQ
jgi:hypothetical protein